jgi:cytoskeletal protein RodZ
LPPDEGGRRSTGPSHRSGDTSLMFSSLGRSVAGGLAAIAVIVAGIVAVNSFQKDEAEAPVAKAARSPKPAADASTSATAGESAATTAPPVAAETETAPEVVTEATTSAATTAPAVAPSAAAPDSPEAAAVRVPLLVLNSSRITGLATSAKKDFEQAGWTVRGVGNTRYRASVTTVYYLPGQEAAARQLVRDVPAVQRMLLRPLALPGQGLTVVVTREYAD